MKPINQQPAFHEGFADFNQVIQSHGYSPIYDISDLTWEQWLDLSSFLYQRGQLAEAHVAKWIGLDLRSDVLNFSSTSITGAKFF